MACQLGMVTPCWRHPYPSLARGSGRLVFGSGQPIRVKMTPGTRGQTTHRSVMARAAMSDVRFRRCFHQWLRLFLLYTVVWSKHNFDNFHFWAKIKHHFKPSALIPIVGNSDRWCSDICPLEAKHTDTIFNVVRQTAYIHGRSHLIIQGENKVYNNKRGGIIPSLATLNLTLFFSSQCCNGSYCWLS